jgi:hypothetical protein
LDAGTQARVITAPCVARNGTDQHPLRLTASRPGDPDAHLLARALRIHRYALDHLPENLFAVRIRRRGRVPQRRDIGGELANGVAFLTRQDAQLLLEDAMIRVLQRLLRLQLLLPGPLQRPGNQAILRFDRLVLSGRTVRLVGRPFPALLPPLRNGGPVVFALFGRGEG